METVYQLSQFSARTAQYLRVLYRSSQIQRENASIAAAAAGAAGPRASLLSLPNDILVLILEHLFDAARCPRGDRICDCQRQWRLASLHLASASRRLRALAAPKLLRAVFLGSSWSAERIQEALSAFTEGSAVAWYAREFKIDLWPPGRPKVVRRGQLADELVRGIGVLVNLRKLGLSVPEENAGLLKQRFEEVRPCFPQVEELVLSPWMEWLLRFCPNLKRLSTNDWMLPSYAWMKHRQSTIETAGEVRGLEHFSLHCYWSDKELRDVLRFMPGLRSLGMPGWMAFNSGSLQVLLPILQSFANLERLELIDSVKLIEYRMIPGGTYLREEHLSKGSGRISPRQECVTRMVFTQLPRLKELRLGLNFKARAVHPDPSDGKACWEYSVFENGGNVDDAPHRMQCYYRCTMTHLAMDDELNRLEISDELQDVMSDDIVWWDDRWTIGTLRESAS